MNSKIAKRDRRVKGERAGATLPNQSKSGMTTKQTNHESEDNGTRSYQPERHLAYTAKPIRPHWTQTEVAQN